MLTSLLFYWLLQNGAKKNQHQESHQRETMHDKFVIFAKLVGQKQSIGWTKYVYVCKWDRCWRNFCVSFLVTKKKVKSRSKTAPFFQISAILKFDFKMIIIIMIIISFFSEENYLNYTKRHNFACGNYIFPNTRAIKNKQWTHLGALKDIYLPQQTYKLEQIPILEAAEWT